MLSEARSADDLVIAVRLSTAARDARYLLSTKFGATPESGVQDAATHQPGGRPGRHFVPRRLPVFGAAGVHRCADAGGESRRQGRCAHFRTQCRGAAFQRPIRATKCGGSIIISRASSTVETISGCRPDVCSCANQDGVSLPRRALQFSRWLHGATRQSSSTMACLGHCRSSGTPKRIVRSSCTAVKRRPVGENGRVPGLWTYLRFQ